MSKVIAMAAAYGMLAAQSENPHFSPYPVNNSPEPEWKRKKCKTCINCGNKCHPYDYRGHVIFRYSKPTSKACKDYKKRK